MAKSKREFGEGPLHTITNYIFWFFLGNLYFFLLNIPLIFVLIVVLSNGGQQFHPGLFLLLFYAVYP